MQRYSQTNGYLVGVEKCLKCQLSADESEIEISFCAVESDRQIYVEIVL